MINRYFRYLGPPPFPHPQPGDEVRITAQVDATTFEVSHYGTRWLVPLHQLEDRRIWRELSSELPVVMGVDVALPGGEEDGA